MDHIRWGLFFLCLTLPHTHFVFSFRVSVFLPSQFSLIFIRCSLFSSSDLSYSCLLSSEFRLLFLHASFCRLASFSLWGGCAVRLFYMMSSRLHTFADFVTLVEQYSDSYGLNMDSDFVRNTFAYTIDYLLSFHPLQRQVPCQLACSALYSVGFHFPYTPAFLDFLEASSVEYITRDQWQVVDSF